MLTLSELELRKLKPQKDKCMTTEFSPSLPHPEQT